MTTVIIVTGIVIMVIISLVNDTIQKYMDNRSKIDKKSLNELKQKMNYLEKQVKYLQQENEELRQQTNKLEEHYDFISRLLKE